jgi:hypothetical protein
MEKSLPGGDKWFSKIDAPPFFLWASGLDVGYTPLFLCGKILLLL